jgi:hypothetical protein
MRRPVGVIILDRLAGAQVVTPASSSSMVMQPSTGQTFTQRLQATHSSSITSKTRSSDIEIAWCEVSSQAA